MNNIHLKSWTTKKLFGWDLHTPLDVLERRSFRERMLLKDCCTLSSFVPRHFCAENQVALFSSTLQNGMHLKTEHAASSPEPKKNAVNLLIKKRGLIYLKESIWDKMKENRLENFSFFQDFSWRRRLPWFMIGFGVLICERPWGQLPRGKDESLLQKLWISTLIFFRLNQLESAELLSGLVQTSPLSSERGPWLPPGEVGYFIVFGIWDVWHQLANEVFYCQNNTKKGCPFFVWPSLKTL